MKKFGTTYNGGMVSEGDGKRWLKLTSLIKENTMFIFIAPIWTFCMINNHFYY